MNRLWMIAVLAACSSEGSASRALDPAAPGDADLAADMADAAHRFLALLPPDVAARVRFGVDDDERTNWHFIPRERRGVPLRELSHAQRAVAYGFLATAFGRRGLLKATGIMALEQVLHEREHGAGQFVRDPGAYFLTIFGEPSNRATWGWRLEGHHLSINVTLVGGTVPIAAPSFFGSAPSRVTDGPLAGTEVLGREEELGLAVIAGLPDAARRDAIYRVEAPEDIFAGPGADLRSLPGLAVAQMDAPSRRAVVALLDEALASLPRELADRERARLIGAGIDRIVFTWLGATTRTEPHYFRLDGPTFLYELDNTQEHATHLHSVWHARDPAGGDFGAGFLREHYRRAHARR